MLLLLLLLLLVGLLDMLVQLSLVGGQLLHGLLLLLKGLTSTEDRYGCRP